MEYISHNIGLHKCKRYTTKYRSELIIVNWVVAYLASFLVLSIRRVGVSLVFFWIYFKNNGTILLVKGNMPSTTMFVWHCQHQDLSSLIFSNVLIKIGCMPISRFVKPISSDVLISVGYLCRPCSAGWKNGWCWFVVREKHYYFAETARLISPSEQGLCIYASCFVFILCLKKNQYVFYCVWKRK
jgi:hypothetical protein